jgi:hypothetical protein
MSVFRTLAYASPVIVGFALPCVLALARERSWPRRAYFAAAPISVVAMVALLFVTWTFSGERFARLLEVSCFLLAYGAFLFGLFHFAMGFGLPPVVAQIVAGVVVVLMAGTVFYFDPILEHAIETNAPREQLQSRIDAAMEWNPYVVVATSIFDEDVLTRRVLYSRTLLSDLPRSYPQWPQVALAYVILGFFLHVGYLGMTALRLKVQRGR